MDYLESLVKLAIEVSKGNKPNSSVLVEPERMLLYISIPAVLCTKYM